MMIHPHQLLGVLRRIAGAKPYISNYRKGCDGIVRRFLDWRAWRFSPCDQVRQDRASEGRRS